MRWLRTSAGIERKTTGAPKKKALSLGLRSASVAMKKTVPRTSGLAGVKVKMIAPSRTAAAPVSFGLECFSVPMSATIRPAKTHSR